MTTEPFEVYRLTESTRVLTRRDGLRFQQDFMGAHGPDSVATYLTPRQAEHLADLILAWLQDRHHAEQAGVSKLAALARAAIDS